MVIRADDFEKQYAARSGVTVEHLHNLGFRASLCNCIDESCQGWQMIFDPDSILMEKIGLKLVYNPETSPENLETMVKEVIEIKGIVDGLLTEEEQNYALTSELRT